ncbi:NarL family two-component system response regulator LiaR [Lipingzhangella halophila]|uniref:NarL family two-component system response regulator LiaR n=1 Tax=Lipingzhangella halophila TaxID=1783352 RepID=A0A7W7RN61_9ACTN|nr:response regulator transcription factor [Lipingzhangella halophila]MBB4935027.1 NarL family two-component system response regulator LiaR [Lipingzhangella halophila]
MSPRVIEILLVEDHPLVRLGLRTVIDAQPDMRVVGESASADSAVAAAQELTPELVILPLRLEGELRGVELCRELKSARPAVRVLIYTSYNSAEDASASFLSGADSFVYKGEESARLLDTLRATAAGRRTWLLGVETQDQSARLEDAVERSGLTQREREVLGFMLQRFTNAQIANELFIELPTVKTHVRSILAKLGLRSRQELFSSTASSRTNA